MLLDGQGPEVVDEGECPLPAQRRVHVDAIEPGPPLVLAQRLQRRPAKRRNEWQHEEEDGQDTVVERENAQHAPHIEISEVVGLGARLRRGCR